MISKKTLKLYGFKDIDEYYGYIIESVINGQFSQAKELISKMSKEQKSFFNGFIEYSHLEEDLKNKIIKFLWV